MSRWLQALAALVVVLLVGAACQSGGSPAPPPAYLLDDGGNWQQMGQSSYCWSGPEGRNTQVVCADAAWPPDSQSPISTGPTLRFQFFRPPGSLNVTLYDAADPAGNAVSFTTLTPTEREVSWLPNVPAGSYVVQVFGRWGADDSSYYAWVTMSDEEDESGIPFQPQSETERPVYVMVGDERVPLESASRVGADGRLVFVPPVNAPLSAVSGEALIVTTDPPYPDRVIFLIETADGSETVLDSDALIPDEEGRASWSPAVSPGDYIVVVTAEWPDTVSVTAFNVEVE